jgi:hypothetical protein
MISLICLITGTISAGASLVCERFKVILEAASGALFLAGLCTLGAELPLFR